MSLKYTFTSAQHNRLLVSIDFLFMLMLIWAHATGNAKVLAIMCMNQNFVSVEKNKSFLCFEFGKERRCLQLTTVLTFYLFNELLMWQTLRHCGRSLLNFVFHFGLFLDSELNGDKLTVANEFPGGHQILCAVLH